MVITEFQHKPEGASLQSALRDGGWIYQFCPILDRNKNTLLIAARENFEVIAQPALHKDDNARCVKIQFEQFVLIGVYFAQNKKKATLWRYLCELAAETVHERLVIIGDFNTGMEGIDGTGYSCWHDFQELTKLWGEDAWRRTHGDQRDFTWYSHKGKADSRRRHQGFRIDHAFISPALKDDVVTAEFSHEVRDKIPQASDHSALSVWLDLNGNTACKNSDL
jgi:exonuclease III